MGNICPFLSTSINQIANIDFGNPTLIGNIDQSDGTTDLTFQNLRGNVNYSNIIQIKTPCIQTECIFWDSSKSRCKFNDLVSGEVFNDVIGTSSDKVQYNGSPQKLIKILSLLEYMDTVFGTTNEALQYDSLITTFGETFSSFGEVIGTEDEANEVGGSILKLLGTENILDYLKDVIGKSSDLIRNGETGILTLMKLTNSFEDVVGSSQDMQSDPSLSKIVKGGTNVQDILNVLGHTDDLNENMTIAEYFHTIIGKKEELDNNDSLIKMFKNIIGTKDQLTNDMSIYEYMDHIHKNHLHFVPHDGYTFDKDAGNTSIPKASILVNEFAGNEDLDGNGYIYGKDFKIKDDDEKPSLLKGIEENPLWVDPNREITWSQYLTELF